MAALVHLILSWLAAFVVVQRFFPQFPALVRLAGAFAVSIVVTGWVSFGMASLAHAAGAGHATVVGTVAALLVNLVIIVLGRRELRAEAFRMPAPALAGALAAMALSGWIMQMRLGGTPLRVSLNTWGDTALHVGIARSFSAGDNYPPQLPIFAGESIRYHFGFDFYAGTLESLGLPIDWAFNIPGALGFTAIMVLLAQLAYRLWGSVWAGIVAAALFVTNGSLAFLRYFAQFPSVLDALAPQNWWQLDKYDAIAPYQDGEVISIFWTLNPYLTQTHLIVSMVVVLFVTYALVWHLRGPGALAGEPAEAFEQEGVRTPLSRPQAVALGVLTGATFWMNGILVLTAVIPFVVLFHLYSGHLRRVLQPSLAVVVIGTGLFVTGSFLDSDGLRILALAVLLGGLVLLGALRESWPFFGALGVLALPQLVWLNAGVSTAKSLFFHNGYLVKDFRFDNPASYLDFVGYWWLNLGLVLPLVVLAAVLARRADRKLLLAIMAIFVFGNVAAFGVDVGGHNHKVFNLWETLVNLFAAYALVWIGRRLWRRARVAALVAVPVLSIGLVLSGLLDFMTLKNDPRYEVFGDRQAAISWMEQNTRPDAVFLTADGDVYTTPTLAGRKVYLGGFSIWAADFGYATTPREQKISDVYSAPDRAGACGLLRGTGVDYVQVSSSEQQDSKFPKRNPNLFPGEFTTAYSDGRYAYFDVRASCGPDPSSVAAAAQR